MKSASQSAAIAAGVAMSFGFLYLGPRAVRAAVITPTSAFASSYYSGPQTPDNLRNDSHMIEDDDNDVLSWVATPDGSANGMWHSDGTSVVGTYVVFDLGGKYDLSAAYIWQMAQNLYQNRGVRSFSLYASSSAPSDADVQSPPASYNLTDFTQILGPSTLSEWSGSGNEPVQAFNLTNATDVRQIYLQVNSAWSGQTNEYVGLSEVKFEGISSAVQYAWSNAAGGSWQTGGNWAIPGPPTADDAAVFSLNNTYTVTSAANAAVSKINVSAGNVTLDLGSTTLQADTINLSGGSLKTSSLVKGAASAGQVGFTSALNFTDGALTIDGGPFTPTSGTGSFAVAGATGGSADPTLNLTNGSVMALGGTSTLDGSITIGTGGGKGTVNVSGSGSAMRAYSSSGALTIGDGGIVSGGIFHAADGTLNISGGGQASSAYPTIIGQNGGVGRVTVDGEGSLLSVTSSVNGYLYVGRETASGQAGNGTLTLTNGGKADAIKSALIGSSSGVGSVSVDGADSVLSAANVSFGSTLGTGTLAVTQGGAVTATGRLDIGDSGLGRVTVDGIGSIISAAGGGMYVGESVYNNTRGDGVLTLTNGGQANSPYGVFVGALGGRGVLNVGKSDGTDVGGTKVTSSTLWVGNGVSAADVSSILNVYAGGSVELTQSLNAYTNAAAPANTRINLAGGTIKTPVLYMEDAAYLNWTSGTLWLTGGTSTTNGTLAVPTAGLLKGSGSISGPVTVAGVVSPGHGIGALNLNGGLTIGSTGAQGTLADDIDFAASTADLLNVTGTVDLANAVLSLSLLNAPTSITTPLTFLLINNDGTDPVTGQFASVDLGTFSNFQYEINYTYNSGGSGIGNDVAITFTAVPEPACLPLILAAAGLLYRRRRQ